MDKLPLVLLGSKTSWREHPSCSASDLIYGTFIRIPEDFIPHVPRNVQASSGFVHQLQGNMSSILPCAHEHHGGHSAYKPDTLASTSYVYIRHDDPGGPLQHPYDGPFKVLEVHDKYYVLNVNGRQDCLHQRAQSRILQTGRQPIDPWSSSGFPLFAPIQSHTVSANNSCASAYCVCLLGQTDPEAHPLHYQ